VLSIRNNACLPIYLRSFPRNFSLSWRVEQIVEDLSE
jgi:hypothetical protein